MKIFSTLFFVVLLSSADCQSFKVLHYSETSGYDHNTRQESFAMLDSLGGVYGFSVDDDVTGTAFNTLTNLQQYDVVVFANTSGDAILSATQQQNFENYMMNGGGFVGIHAASDTYRHSTANGTSTGSWDWYAEMVGASVQQSPNHVQGTPQYSMSKIGSHFTNANLPDPWVKNEEYYYWESGYFDSTNNTVLKVEETIGPNGMVNSYDSSRAMSWYRHLNNGGRSFYTALGHSASDYTDNSEFITHIRDAILWASGTVGTPEHHYELDQLKAFYDRSNEQIIIEVPPSSLSLRVVNMNGMIVHREKLNDLESKHRESVNISEWANGVYIVECSGKYFETRIKMVIER